jgi:hypothetical protein
MITMRRDKDLWTVGIVELHLEAFVPWIDCNSLEEAFAWVSYLNGGLHPRNNHRQPIPSADD